MWDDDDDADFPEETITTIGDVKVGVVHGHDVQPWGDAKALEARRRRLDVDVLVSGHTHRAEVREEGDYLYLNPGSITGAYAPATKDRRTVLYPARGPGAQGRRLPLRAARRLGRCLKVRSSRRSLEVAPARAFLVAGPYNIPGTPVEWPS